MKNIQMFFIVNIIILNEYYQMTKEKFKLLKKKIILVINYLEIIIINFNFNILLIITIIFLRHK